MPGIPGAGEFLLGYVNNDFNAYIKNSPDQIAAFIMKNQYAETTITNIFDVREIETVFGSFIMYCSNQKFLQECLLPVLIPMQRGEVEAAKFISYTSDNIEN